MLRDWSGSRLFARAFDEATLELVGEPIDLLVDIPITQLGRMPFSVSADGPLAGLIVASPANPTGTMVDRAELTAISQWCGAHGVRLVSDEIYHGVTYPDPGEVDPRGVCAWEVDDSAIVRKLTARVPGDRYESARALADALKKLLAKEKQTFRGRVLGRLRRP